jgi:hypothetical protein
MVSAIDQTKRRFQASSARRTGRWRKKQIGKRVEAYLDPRMVDVIGIEAQKRGLSRTKFIAALIQYGWPVYGRRGL